MSGYLYVQHCGFVARFLSLHNTLIFKLILSSDYRYLNIQIQKKSTDSAVPLKKLSERSA